MPAKWSCASITGSDPMMAAYELAKGGVLMPPHTATDLEAVGAKHEGDSLFPAPRPVLRWFPDVEPPREAAIEVRRGPKGPLLRVDGVTSPDGANALRGVEVAQLGPSALERAVDGHRAASQVDGGLAGRPHEHLAQDEPTEQRDHVEDHPRDPADEVGDGLAPADPGGHGPASCAASERVGDPPAAGARTTLEEGCPPCPRAAGKLPPAPL